VFFTTDLFGPAARASRAFDPPTSSSLAEERTPLLPPPQHGGRTIADARSSQAGVITRAVLLAQSRSIALSARSESAAVVVARRGKNASARSSSVRRRAISRRSQLACRSGCGLCASRLESLRRRSSQRRPAVDLSDFAQQVGPSPSRPFHCLFAAPCGDPLVMAAHEHLGNIQPTPAGWFGVDRSLQ
jgi:hypothetical protein